MSFDEILDLTADVFFLIYNKIEGAITVGRSQKVGQTGLHCRPYQMLVAPSEQSIYSISDHNTELLPISGSFSFCSLNTGVLLHDYLAPGTVPSVHPDASASIRMHSYASVTHPYAPICLHTPPLRIRTLIFNTHFSENVKKTTNCTNPKFIIDR